MLRKTFLTLALALITGVSASPASAQQPGPAAGALSAPLSGPGVPLGPPQPINAPISVPASVFGMQGTVTQGVPIPPGPAPTYFTPQQAVALTNTYTTGSPLVTQQTQVYTPTFYYYYYTPPYYVNYTPVAPMAPMMAVGAYDMSGMYGGMAGPLGPMSNARGEMGHVRYPFHSYRRPWYFPGQPSFNVTIDGPVW